MSGRYVKVVLFSYPGSAWACRVNEAQPLISFRAQAEPGHEGMNSPLLFHRDQTDADGVPDQSGNIVDVELVHQTGAVRFDGFLAAV